MQIRTKQAGCWRARSKSVKRGSRFAGRLEVSRIQDQTLFLEKLMKNWQWEWEIHFGPLGTTGEYSYSCGPGLPNRLTQSHRGMVFLEWCASQVLRPVGVEQPGRIGL